MTRRRWSILYEEGARSFLPDGVGVLEVTETSESTVPNAPIEDGSFSAYNKVLAPKRLSVKIASEGSTVVRGTFENNLKTAQESLDTFMVCSDIAAWSSMTIESVSRSISASEGIYLTIYDVEFVEVMKVRLVEGGPESVKDPVNAKVKKGGNKQAKTVNESEQTKLVNSFKNTDKWDGK